MNKIELSLSSSESESGVPGFSRLDSLKVASQYRHHKTKSEVRLSCVCDQCGARHGEDPAASPR